MFTEEIEVELRFGVECLDQAKKVLYQGINDIPEFSTIKWETKFFGKKILEEGKLFRLSKTTRDTSTEYHIGWKDEDVGSNFVNIRKEYSEQVDIANICSSIVELKLGKNNPESWLNFDDIDSLASEKCFMAFSGVNLCGEVPEKGLVVKIMTADIDEWPVLVEIEKVASCLDEASQFEEQLVNYSRSIGVTDRLICDEPPTILYNQIFTD